MLSTDEYYMNRAIELAGHGKLHTSPNPRVGAVIVHNNKIIGEGYHRKYGEAHAEVNAVNQVKHKHLLKEATLYVSLEPCSHHGKTPPCTNLILLHKIPRVVIANQDPFDKVNGKGWHKLMKEGVKVEVGILEKKAHELNKRFFTFHKEKRPYIILKWAKTKDGFMGRLAHDNKDNWITNSISKQLVHAWRAEEDAILVGKKTVIKDNPRLTCRNFAGKNPSRIIIDPSCELSTDFHVFNKDAPTIILNSLTNKQSGNIRWLKIDFNDFINEFNSLCIQHSFLSVLVEGGSYTLSEFIRQGNWDEARIFTGNKWFRQGISSPEIIGKTISSISIEGDILRIVKK